MTNILMIHHAKNFESNASYLSDDFFLANTHLFGAQEMDTWAGYRLLQQSHQTFRLQISQNLGRFQLLHGSQVISDSALRDPKTSNLKNMFNYGKTLFQYLDTTIASNMNSSLKVFIEKLIHELDISLIWCDTQFYDALLPKKFPIVIRSVNFEPFHVMREDPSQLRYIRRLGKLVSERRIARTRTLVPISPRDLHSYRILAKGDYEVLPLRQLPFLMQSLEKSQVNSTNSEFEFPFVYFAGSNFDVKHNLDNLRRITEVIAPRLYSRFPKLRILIFGHKFPSNIFYPSNVIKMYFRKDYHSIIQRSIAALVPSPGGSGMQSKVYEALCMGIPLIAHHEALSRFPFYSNEHYLPGSTVTDFIESIEYLLSNREEALLMGKHSSLLCRQLFHFDLFRATMNEAIHRALVR